MWQKVMLFKNESKSHAPMEQNHAPQEWGRGVMLPREQNHAPPRMGSRNHGFQEWGITKVMNSNPWRAFTQF